MLRSHFLYLVNRPRWFQQAIQCFRAKQGPSKLGIWFIIWLRLIQYVLLFFALYGHSFSIGQSRQRTASPAALGLLDFRKCFKDPNDETFNGVAGLNQWHIRSMSLFDKIINVLNSKKTYRPLTGNTWSSAKMNLCVHLTNFRAHRNGQSDSSQLVRSEQHSLILQGHWSEQFG